MERRSFSWLFRRRTVGVLLFIVAFLATLMAVFHLVENWRGQKKWEAYKRTLVAQGVKLDLAAFIPPPIPDQQNFAASPFFDELLPGPRPTNWSRWPELISKLRPEKASGKRNERQLTDLPGWQKALRVHTRGDTNPPLNDRVKAAEELLAAMKVYEPALQELRAASQRPLTRYNLRYDLENPWGILLPHLAVIKEVCQVLSLKACAELAAGDSERALGDVRLIARLSDSLEQESFLISYLVRLACLQIVVQPVWEGLALDRWSDAQLAELQSITLRFNLIAQLPTSFGAERAAGILTADLLLKQRNKADFLNALMGPSDYVVSGGFGNFVAWLIPRGWYHMEQFNYARLFQDYVLPGFDESRRIVYPAVAERSVAQLDQVFKKAPNRLLSHYMLAQLCLPAVGTTQRKAAQGQTVAHQVAIACALERYRRAHRTYPAELAALQPELLASVPHDVIGGKPYHYKATQPIVLYSVGWDDQDNGGSPGKVLWDETGDWVWTYPAAPQ